MYISYNLPKDGIVNGTCGNGTNDQIIWIKWNNNSVFNMTFKLKQHEYSLHKISLSLSNEILPNANQTSGTYYYVGSAFGTQANRSYRCTRDQTLNLTATENSTDIVGTVTFSKTLLEAYHMGGNKQYSAPIDCDAISTPGNILEKITQSHIIISSNFNFRYCTNRRWNCINCTSRHSTDCLFSWSKSLPRKWLCQHVNVKSQLTTISGKKLQFFSDIFEYSNVFVSNWNRILKIHLKIRESA